MGCGYTYYTLTVHSVNVSSVLQYFELLGIFIHLKIASKVCKQQWELVQPCFVILLACVTVPLLNYSALTNTSLTHHWQLAAYITSYFLIHFISNSLYSHYLPHLRAGKVPYLPEYKMTHYNLKLSRKYQYRKCLISCVILKWPSIFQIIGTQVSSYIQVNTAVWFVLLCCYSSVRLSCIYQKSSQSCTFFSMSTLWQMYRVPSLSNRKTLLHTCLFASRTHIWLPITGHSSADVTTICNIKQSGRSSDSNYSIERVCTFGYINQETKKVQQIQEGMQ